MAKKSNEVIAVTPEYTTHLNAFVDHLRTATGETYAMTAGRKFDKVFRLSESGKKCAFMVERSTGSIYGTKSWVMINHRRAFGTLGTIADWTWTGKRPIPNPGTPSADAHAVREAAIASKYGPRGRPRKALAPSS